MSPRELEREFEAASDRIREDIDRDIAMAWRIAALSRMETLPKLEALLTSKTRRRQTPEEHRRALQTLSERYRIPLREVVH